MKQKLLLSLALSLLMATSASAGQDRLLSKKSKGFNSFPAFAVNPTTGDLLAVWVRDESNPLSREVWVGRAKRKSNGKFKKRVRAQKLSPPGALINLSPQVAWVEANGEFFVVWERKASFGPSPTDIVGHAVSKTGKPKGELIVLNADGKSNFTPTITASVASGIRVYHSNGADKGRWRVNSASLSNDYSVDDRATVSKQKKAVALVLMAGVIDLSSQGSDAIRSRARSGGTSEDCVVLIHTTYDEASRPTAWVILKVGDEREVVQKFPGQVAISIKKISAVFDYITVLTGNGSGGLSVWTAERGPDECLLKSSDSQSRPFFDEGLAAELMAPTTSLPLNLRILGEEGAIGYFVSSETDGQVYEQEFDETLTLLGNQDVVFDHGGTLTFLRGGDITADSTRGTQPNSVVLWTKDTGNGKQEVRANFFYLPPLE